MTKTYVRTIKPYREHINDARKVLTAKLRFISLTDLAKEIGVSKVVLKKFVLGGDIRIGTFDKVWEYILRFKQ